MDLQLKKTLVLSLAMMVLSCMVVLRGSVGFGGVEHIGLGMKLFARKVIQNKYARSLWCMEFGMKTVNGVNLFYCSSIPVVTCPTLYAPYNGMKKCSTKDHVPTPEPSYPYYKRFFQHYYYDYYNHGKSEDKSTVGDICTFSCDKDYVISGSDIRTCENDGSWSGTSVTCESKYCNDYFIVLYICNAVKPLLSDISVIHNTSVI